MRNAGVARDYYGTLGVAQDAGPDEIKRAYRRLARELHPDVNPDPAAQDRFAEVSAAYEVLSDPEKRRVVDLGGDPMGNGGGGGGDPFAGAGAFGFGDIMDAFFGGGGGGRGRGPRSRVQPGADALIRMRLTLDECATGVTRDLTVDTAVLCGECTGSGCAPGSAPALCDICDGRGEVQSVQRSFLGQVVTARVCPNCRGFGEVIPDPCRQCGGDGRVRSRRSVAVRIPAGVADGMRVRLADQGEVGPGGGPAGDLYVELHVAEHDVFTRRGRDLLCTVTVPMTSAALGATLTLPTLESDLSPTAALEAGLPEHAPHEVALELRPGTQSGTEVVLPGHGVPSLRGPGRGDIVARVVVETPTRLDDRQQDLLRQLAELRGEERATGSVGGEQKASVFNRLFRPR